MTGLHLRPWEPEETIGTLWHRLVGDRPSALPPAAPVVTLAAMRVRMGIMLRGLGGDPGAGFAVLQADEARHRRSFLQRIGHAGERVMQPGWDGETLSVPAAPDDGDTAQEAAASYLWFAAWAALAVPPLASNDPLRQDLENLRAVRCSLAAIARAAPGLAITEVRMNRRALARRPATRLPAQEAQVECLLRHLLGAGAAADPAWQEILYGDAPLPDGFAAAPGYHSFTPVFHWPRWLSRAAEAAAAPAADSATSGKPPAGDGSRKRARRRAADQARRRDPLILHRFETIKTWAEKFNLGRKVEDDDPETARKAADDQNELGLADTDGKPATRLAFDLDLAPQEVDRAALQDGLLYPEWDWRKGRHLPDHVRVLAARPAPGTTAPQELDSAQARLIARVRRQFEALMPRHILQGGEDAGSELDLDAALRLAADRHAGLAGDHRIFRSLRPLARDLAVLTLADVSRSTEGVAEERPVIAIAREALLAMAHGLAATGDAHAIAAFSSVRRDKVFYDRIMDFGESLSAAVTSRILSLRPGHYTRLGAAIRHATHVLRGRPAQRRLLLIVTDGKPNDVDYYEGRYGIEDTRRAVLEARMAGIAVFAITIDKRAESYVPHIFGRNGFHCISHPARLAEALPGIYRHLVS
jgi:nitric oxide reductase NorD protein